MTEERKVFRPYRDATLDSPLSHFVQRPFLCCLYPFIRILLPIRWFLSQPFQIRLLPKCFPVLKWPGFESLPYITIGHFVLVLPQIYLLYLGYQQSFGSARDVEQSGHTASFALVLTYFTSFKSNSAISFFFGLSYERMIPYHNWSAVVAVIIGILHTYVAFVYGGSSDPADNSQYSVYAGNPKFILFCFDQKKNASGTILILFMILLVGTSLFPIMRRWNFNLWLFIHILSAICVVIFSFQHEVNVVVITSVFWIIDLFVRHVVMALCKYPTKANLRMILPDVVEISFPKGNNFDYRAGQFVHIAVPKVSWVEFHPITISSAPHESNVTMHVQVIGDWSGKLAELSRENQEVTIFVEGPYGSLSIDLNNDRKYQMILMISGGIGVTPCQSIAKSVLEDKKGGRKLHKIRYVWAVRNMDLPLAMSPLSKDNADENVSSLTSPLLTYDKDDLNGPIQIDVFDTSESAEDTEKNSEINKPFNHHFGRPNLDDIFTEIKEEVTQHRLKHVAVISCGPSSMLDDVREACRKHSSHDLQCCGVRFDLHEEVFNN